MRYFLALSDPTQVSDPSEAFSAAAAYVAALHAQYDEQEFARRMDEEMRELGGHVEQDLRHYYRALGLDMFERTELEQRLRECIDYALNQLG